MTLLSLCEDAEIVKQIVLTEYGPVGSHGEFIYDEVCGLRHAANSAAFLHCLINIFSLFAIFKTLGAKGSPNRWLF